MFGHRSVALGGLLPYSVQHAPSNLHLTAGYVSDRSFDDLLQARPFSMYNLDRLPWHLFGNWLWLISQQDPLSLE